MKYDYFTRFFFLFECILCSILLMFFYLFCNVDGIQITVTCCGLKAIAIFKAKPVIEFVGHGATVN